MDCTCSKSAPVNATFLWISYLAVNFDDQPCFSKKSFKHEVISCRSNKWSAVSTLFLTIRGSRSQVHGNEFDYLFLN